MRKPEFTAHRIPDPPPGWRDQSFAILRDGRLGVLRTNVLWGDQPSFHESWKTTRWRSLITAFDGTSEEVLGELPAFRWPLFDMNTGGNIVVVEAQGSDNTDIYGADGTRKARFDAGDGVERMLVTPDDQIWVAYFDEGIFGTAQRPDGSWPPAAHGLARFAPDGECTWHAPTHQIRIDDCYALTANGQEVWFCPYSNFPIAQVSGDSIRTWANDRRGAHAMAVHDSSVILAGGYAADHGKLTLLSLLGEKAQILAEAHLSLSKGAQLIGRDGALHIIDERRWLRLAVSDWIAAFPAS